MMGILWLIVDSSPTCPGIWTFDVFLFIRNYDICSQMSEARGIFNVCVYL